MEPSLIARREAAPQSVRSLRSRGVLGHRDRLTLTQLLQWWATLENTVKLTWRCRTWRHYCWFITLSHLSLLFLHISHPLTLVTCQPITVYTIREVTQKHNSLQVEIWAPLRCYCSLWFVLSSMATDIYSQSTQRFQNISQGAVKHRSETTWWPQLLCTDGKRLILIHTVEVIKASFLHWKACVLLPTV